MQETGFILDEPDQFGDDTDGYDQEENDYEEEASEEAGEEEVEESETVKEGEKREEGQEAASPDENEEKDEDFTIEAADGTKLSGKTVFRKKVDGKLVDVTLKQALDRYAGDLAVDKRFSEANTLKQKAEHQLKITQKERDEVISTVNAFLDSIKSGHIRDAFDEVCKLTGQDAQEQYNHYKKAQVEFQRKLAEMSEDELQRAELEEENAYWKRRSERREQSKVDQDKEYEITREIDKVSEEVGISREMFNAGYNALVDMKQKGEYNGPIDVRTAAQMGWDIATWRLIDQTVQENLPDMAANHEFYNEILRDTKTYKLSKDDWTTLLSEIKAEQQEKQSSSNLKRKAKKAAKVKPAKPKEEQTNAEKEYSYEDDDDDFFF